MAKEGDALALLRVLSDTHPDGSLEILGMDSGMEWKGTFGSICDKERIRREG